MTTLYLNDGTPILVSDEDYEAVSQYRWSPLRSKQGRVYGQRQDYSNPGHPRKILLHRQIMNAADGQVIDHINRNTRDCQRSNLRVASYSENKANSGKTSMPCTSQYKGVWRIASGRWGASIMLHGRGQWLKAHDTEVEAAFAYDRAARQKFGEFALVNFPTPEPDTAYVADCMVAYPVLCALPKVYEGSVRE